MQLGDYKWIIVNPEIAKRIKDRIYGDRNESIDTGPVRLYEKAGFTEFSRIVSAIVMRKAKC